MGDLSANLLPTILVVDDEPSVLELLEEVVGRIGFRVVTCSGGEQAIQHLQRHRSDLALVDLRMPGVGGIEVLRAIREADPECKVVLMSGQATIDSAVEAVKLGAIDYLVKPFDTAKLRRILQLVIDDRTRLRDLLAAEGEVARRAEFRGMVGRGAIMQQLFALIRRLAPHVRTVLITGETGSGKELVARALHVEGPRQAKRFVTINCAAVVDTLFESELFGHARGAFTGAIDNKPGLFEAADGGTIFLDEVGELPLNLQAKLLRVLESGEIQRVGSLEPRHVDVHVIAATNRDLFADVASGRFRADLYYRLNVVELRVPALRERREDLPFLTAAFVQEFAERFHKPITGLTAGAERALASAPWEGNVRELRNVIERGCVLADGEFLTERVLAATAAPGRPRAAPVSAGPPERALDGSLKILERAHILEVLARVDGNKAKAAKILGLGRRTFYRRLETHGIVSVRTPAV